LQSLGGIPTTWAIGNLYFQGILGCRSVSILALVSITSNQGGGYFSGNPRLPQLGLLAAPQPFSVSILALVSITGNQGGGPMDPRFFPNEQGSSSGHTHQPTSQSATPMIKLSIDQQ